MANNRVADRKSVLGAVSAALKELVAEDRPLLALQDHELALVHRLGVYLERRLTLALKQYRLTVDLDYDRHKDLRKQLRERPGRKDERRFRPDLIVHNRRDDAHNLLVVEWEKNPTDPVLRVMEDRIRSLITNDGIPSRSRYQTGVLVKSSDTYLRWCAFDGNDPAPRWQQVG
jgi:hypothetical protein